MLKRRQQTQGALAYQSEISMCFVNKTCGLDWFGPTPDKRSGMGSDSSDPVGSKLSTANFNSGKVQFMLSIKLFPSLDPSPRLFPAFLGKRTHIAVFLFLFNFSIYTLSDLGDVINLIGSLSRTIQH